MPQAIEVITYQFEELPESIQDKLIEDNRYYELEDTLWSEYTIDYVKELGKSFGFDINEIYFRASHCQGDGSCIIGTFDSKDIDIEKALEHYTKLNYAIDQKDLFIERLEKLKVYQTTACLTNDSSHYCQNHYTHSIDIETLEDVTFNTQYMDSIVDKFVQQWYNDMEELILDFVSDINSLVMTSLYDEIEYYTSDEYIKERLIDLDYSYTIEGQTI